MYVLIYYFCFLVREGDAYSYAINDAFNLIKIEFLRKTSYKKPNVKTK